jgi:putative tricarboxylic transport membrane protein
LGQIMQDNGTPASRTVVSHRVMEIVVALLFLGVAAIVIMDSLRIGAGWVDPDGPQAGYFPLRIGAIMAIASLVTLLQNVMLRDGSRSFVDRHALGQVLIVLIPAAVYVLVLDHIGIYVASAIYIAAFMMYMGRYNIVASVAVGIGVSVALFFMFEIWFLVPLPKGPLEEWLGY